MIGSDAGRALSCAAIMRPICPWPALLTLLTACAGPAPRHTAIALAPVAASDTGRWLAAPADATTAGDASATLAPDALAPDPTPQRGRGQRPAPAPGIEIAAGIGFTASPGSLLVAGEADIPIASQSSVGPLLQIGVTDQRVLFAPAFHFRHEFALPAETGIRGLTPWVQVGAGLLYAYESLPRGSHDDVGPLLLLGGGVEWALGSQVSARVGALLDVMPAEVLDEHLILSVQLFALSFRL